MADVRKPSLSGAALAWFLCLPQVMDFYCQSCETAMCRECTEGEHAEHPTVPLKDVVEQHKASLQVQLDAVNKRCAHLPLAPNWSPAHKAWPQGLLSQWDGRFMSPK